MNVQKDVPAQMDRIDMEESQTDTVRRAMIPSEEFQS